MAQRCFRLALTAPLRVGEVGIGLEETLSYVPSDTLFSALVVTWLEMGVMDPAPDLPAVFGEAPVLLTSAMPYVGDVRFFPKPALDRAPDGADAQGKDRRKGFKRVQWVSEGIWQTLLADPETGLDTLWDNSRTIQHGAALVSDAEAQRIDDQLAVQLDGSRLIWHTEKRPHVALDRRSAASNLYHVGDVRYAQDAGLWLAVEGDATWLERTRQALLLLADTGIGGRRSRGYGQFVLEEAPATWPALPRNGGAQQVLLSRCAPQEQQMDHLRAQGSSYRLVTVGGFHGTPGVSPFVRAPVRMLAEGSVVQQSAAPLGGLVDVTPQTYQPERLNHKVYRYGFGFGVAAGTPDTGGRTSQAEKEA